MFLDEESIERHDAETIDEAYFGKPKLCIEMEQAVHDIREEMKNNDAFTNLFNKSHKSSVGSKAAEFANATTSLATLSNVYSFKAWDRLRKLLEKQFGFYSVDLLMKSYPAPNCFTYSVSTALDVGIITAFISKTTNQGISFNKKWRICTVVVITDSLMADEDMTDGEIVAVLMHEIGHNFENVLSPGLIAPNFVFSLLGLRDILSIPTTPENKIEAIFAKFNTLKIISSQATHNPIAAYMYSLYQIVKSMSIFVPMVTRLLYRPYIVVKNIMDNITRLERVLNRATDAQLGSILSGILIGYSKETVADKFASMHGYGPELISGLRKMEEKQVVGTDQLIDNIPIIGHLYGLILLASKEIIYLTDPHPENSARLYACMDAIEDDAKNEHLNPKTKLELMKNLDTLRELIETYDEKATKNNAYSSRASAMFQKFLLKLLPGFGDIRSIVTKPFTYQGTIDKIVNSNRE